MAAKELTVAVTADTKESTGSGATRKDEAGEEELTLMPITTVIGGIYRWRKSDRIVNKRNKKQVSTRFGNKETNSCIGRKNKYVKIDKLDTKLK